MGENADRVVLSDLRFDCVVGVLESEQRATQPLVVDLELWLPLGSAGVTGALAASVDYAAVASQVRMIAQHGRFRLIESLGTAVCRWLLLPPALDEARAEILQVDVTLRKPTILGGAAVPGVRLTRRAEALPATQASPGVTLETLVDLPQGGAWRVVLAPGARWWVPGDLAFEVAAGWVEADGARVRAGERLARGAAESVAAPEGAALLAVGRLT